MSGKVKVLQVIGGMYLGGAERVVHNIVKKKDDSKFDISIYCTHGIGELGDDLINDGYTVDLLGRGTGILKTLRKVKQYVTKTKPDVIHTHSISAFLAIAPLVVFTKMPPWVHTFHFGNYPHIKKQYLYAKRLFGRFATKLVAVSESQRNAVISHLSVKPDKIMTIFNGVTSNPFLGSLESRAQIRNEFAYTDDDIVLSCIVVLTEQKGIPYLLNSIDKIVDANPNVKLLIVGGGPLEDELQRQVSKLRHKECVKFAGWRSDVHQIMTGIDVFVLPSLWEGLPMVLLEAMATALPVLVTNVADNLNVVGQGESGYVVPSADSDALTESAIKLVSDMDKAKAMGQLALQRYQSKYTVNKMVSAYEKLYLDVQSTK
ncbi:MAG: glycosyltransferase [Gammaproteobacteria bacterium]|nr:glycosyltransferase [Gammaproteobacteria bacterium]